MQRYPRSRSDDRRLSKRNGLADQEQLGEGLGLGWIRLDRGGKHLWDLHYGSLSESLIFNL